MAMGDPDRLYAKPGGAGGTESGTDRKNQNNKSTVHAFVFHRRIFADMVQAEIFGRTSHISDAHGCCTWNTAEFAEGIDLHGTGERKHDVRDHIEGRFIRQKSGDPEDQDFYDQNNLPPMDLDAGFIKMLDPFRKVYTKKKSGKRQKITQGMHQVSGSDILSEQYNVSGRALPKHSDHARCKNTHPGNPPAQSQKNS